MFFFFKQKTAYEMRISDWSSDVCSSDLTGLFTVEDQADAEATAAAAALAHQVEVARLEHAQPQRRAGQQDGVQREQGQGFGGHRRQANAARVGAAQKKRSIGGRSEEHTSELQSLMRISYAVFCLKKKKSKKM